jgi:signal transduction histidine kinase/CheY-like chemotaxis protein
MAAVFAVCSMIILILIYAPSYIGRGNYVNLAIPTAVCCALILCSIPVLRYIKKVWSGNMDAGYFQAANLLAVFSMVAFILIRLPEYISHGLYVRAAALLVCCLGAILIMILLMLRVKKISTLAFFIPAVIFILYTAGTIFLGGSFYYFLIYLVICGIGAAYCDYKKFFWFLILAHGAVLILILLGAPLSNEDISFSDMLVNWIATVYVSIFSLMLSRFSTEKSSRSSRALNTFSTLMTTTPNLVALVDGMSRVMYISRPLAVLAHIEDYEMAAGRPLIDLFPEMDMKLMICDVLNAGGFYEDTRELTLNGEIRHFKIIADNLHGTLGGKFIDISDITPIVQAKFEAERSAEAKSVFLANTSHEIRTPMNAILGVAELMLRKELPQDVREDAAAIRQAGSNLLSIINDILDFSKIESGKMEIVPAEYEFASLVNDVVGIIRTRLIEKDILFTVNLDSKLPRGLVGDEARVRQILLNLLSNAVKYTREGTIALTVEGTWDPDGSVALCFEISDTGVGIKAEDMGKLFGDFSRLDTHKNRGVEGTGLGLAISRNLCRMMGGDIRVRSAYGKGSTFTAVLPQKIKAPEPFAAVRSPETKQVLIYETRVPYADSIVRSVENLGVRCTFANIWEDFTQHLENGRYPFIFAPGHLFEKVYETAGQLAPESALILLAEFGELIVRNNVCSIAMPAHSLSIANALNGMAGDAAGDRIKDSGVRFIMPEARILIVDDIATNLKVAAGLLAPYRARVDCREGGLEAIERTRESPYDLIFMDHMMPGMDGIEAAAAIRALPGGRFREVPIIALTANAVSGMREMFLENGFQDYLAKPIEISKLNEIVAKWIPPEKQERLVETEERAPASRGTDFAPPEPELAIDGVDTARGVAMTGGSARQYQEVLALYCRDAAERLELLREAPDEAHLALFITQVHALKSASASIGAAALSERAAELEAAGRRGDLDFVRENLGGFHEALALLVSHIRAALSAAKERRKADRRKAPGSDRREGNERRSGMDRRELAETGAAAVDGAAAGVDAAGADDALTPDQAALLRLKKALEAERVGEADGAVKDLLRRWVGTTTGETLSRIEDCVLVSDFQEAADIMDELLEGRFHG